MAHKSLGPDQFGIDIHPDGIKIFLPDRLITREDLKILLEGIRDLITEYNNVTMEALRASRPQNTQGSKDETTATESA